MVVVMIDDWWWLLLARSWEVLISFTYIVQNRRFWTRGPQSLRCQHEISMYLQPCLLCARGNAEISSYLQHMTVDYFFSSWWSRTFISVTTKVAVGSLSEAVNSLIHIVTTCSRWAVCTSGSYSEMFRFECLPEDRLFWLSCSVVFLSPSSQMMK